MPIGGAAMLPIMMAVEVQAAAPAGGNSSGSDVCNGTLRLSAAKMRRREPLFPKVTVVVVQ